MRRGFWWYCPPEGKCALAARARARESTGSNRTPHTQGCKRMCRIQRGRRPDRGIGEGRHARSSPQLPNLQHRGKSRPDTRRGPSSCLGTRPPSNRRQRSLSCMHTCHCGSSRGTAHSSQAATRQWDALRAQRSTAWQLAVACALVTARRAIKSSRSCHVTLLNVMSHHVKPAASELW